MSNNSFGSVFKVTTFGESHGPAIGVVIDGCPAGLALEVEEIQQALDLRAPGRNGYTSPRQEKDQVMIQSGVFEGVTTGAPIMLLIQNHDADTSKYEAVKHILKPGHANYTYLEKYGVYDHRGGGRASARETACRVAAGAVATKLLANAGIEIHSYLSSVAEIELPTYPFLTDTLETAILASPIFCPDPETSDKMQVYIETLKASGDSVGGMVVFLATGVPAGLGDPVYEKLEAKLASAMLSIPASKGFEIGAGFSASRLRGSQHNDAFGKKGEQVTLLTNHAGGTLGGISTGAPVFGRVAFKPTSSIQLPQASVTTSGTETVFQLPEGSRHDPCVAIRAVPVVKAMLALVLADCYLKQRLSKL